MKVFRHPRYAYRTLAGKPVLRWRIIQFFEANPEEMLTAQDASTKFGVQLTHCRKILNELLSTGRILRTYNGWTTKSVYFLNPKGTPDA